MQIEVLRMPESFDINSSSGNYRITIGENALQNLKERYKDVFYIIDARLAPTLDIDRNDVLAIDATEENKSLEVFANYVIALREKKVHRKTHLIVIGGGVIQDIATFLASIYMRGLKWTYLPTTLLGMVDSCIGGKSSINVTGYKNLVGNFYPPHEIAIDLTFLNTLSVEAIIAGLCETAKICYAYSDSTFEAYLSDMANTTRLNTKVAESIVSRSLKSKKWFIEIDEFDQKERLLLNFGHTFGHALESASNFRISHGIGVGVGMIVAIKYAENHQLLNSNGVITIERFNYHIQKLLREIHGLQEILDDLDLLDVMGKFESDKKHQAEYYRVVVPANAGRLELLSIEKSNRSREDIIQAFDQAFNCITTNN